MFQTCGCGVLAAAGRGPNRKYCFLMSVIRLGLKQSMQKGRIAAESFFLLGHSVTDSKCV